MMDFSEHSPLHHMPAGSLTLQLSRSAIKMSHDAFWDVDKINGTHDLMICSSGGGDYLIGDDPEPVKLREGHAMLVPAMTRFRGKHYGGPEQFVGVAQHFTLKLFGREDFLSKLVLRRIVRLRPWSVFAPLVTHYHTEAFPGGTTLVQHSQFMVLLLAYLEEAIVDWKPQADTLDPQDQLTVHIMRMVTRLSADMLGIGTDDILKQVPYNKDYFRRAFKERTGVTPHKFRERKRMEFAVRRIGLGLPINVVAAELGYSDPYFFSRMFKRFMGDSPSAFKPGGERGPEIKTSDQS